MDKLQFQEALLFSFSNIRRDILRNVGVDLYRRCSSEDNHLSIINDVKISFLQFNIICFSELSFVVVPIDYFLKEIQHVFAGFDDKSSFVYDVNLTHFPIELHQLGFC